MRLRVDPAELHVLVLDDIEWTPSPSPGVERRMLDRDGDEVAVCTTVVRYAAGSRFPTHTHGGGEEFLVLDGVFSDERGDYPAGTYVRNPPGSSHAPFTEPGCTILVKLRQMPEGEAQMVVRGELPESGERVLYDSPGRGVRVALRALRPGEAMELRGREILVLDGEGRIGDQRFSGRTWARVPVDRALALRADAITRVWTKEGHLGRT